MKTTHRSYRSYLASILLFLLSLGFYFCSHFLSRYISFFYSVGTERVYTGLTHLFFGVAIVLFAALLLQLVLAVIGKDRRYLLCTALLLILCAALFTYTETAYPSTSVTLIQPEIVSVNPDENTVVFESRGTRISLYCPSIVLNLIDASAPVGSVLYETYTNDLTTGYIRQLELPD